MTVLRTFFASWLIALAAVDAAQAQSTPLRNESFVLSMPGHWLLKADYDSVLVGDDGQVVSVETSVFKGDWPTAIRDQIVRDEAAQARDEVEQLPARMQATLQEPVRIRRLASGGDAYSVTVRKSDGSMLELFLVLHHPVSVRITVECASNAAHAVAHAAVEHALDSMVWAPPKATPGRATRNAAATTVSP
jgi:hypothetical protein